jgi:hypothetical protein
MNTLELPLAPPRASRAQPVALPDALPDAERQRCEIWTRVMGYHRPVASFNAGKQAEHAERRFFRLAPNGARG